MAEVHNFPQVSTLLPGFRIPFQYIGTGEPPAAKAIPDSVLLDWIIENLGLSTTAQTLSSGDTISAPIGLLQVIAVKSAVGARTIKVGTSAGADDILDLTDIDSGSDFSASIHRYTSSILTLHFTITGGTADVLIFSKSSS